MKHFLFSLGLAASAPPALACNPDLLTVQDWQAEEYQEMRMFPLILEADVIYEGARPFRMIHAGVMFSDVLGGRLGQVNIKRDTAANPGDTIVADAQVQVESRMAEINRDDVTHQTCVWSIVYDDGTIEQFD